MVKSAFGVLEPVWYCAMRTSAERSGKPISIPRYFCVMPRILRKKWIRSPIAIVAAPICMCDIASIADKFRAVKQNLSKNIKYFSKIHLTEAIMFSTIELRAKQNCFEKWMTVQAAPPRGSLPRLQESGPRDEKTAQHRIGDLPAGTVWENGKRKRKEG